MHGGVYQVDPSTLARFIELRDAAVIHALEASARAFAGDLAQLGAEARLASAEYIGLHLDFLHPALETGDIAPFIGYLAWLVQMSSSRGVPQLSVLRPLDDLAAFFHEQLGAQGRPIVAALAAGKEALEAGIAAPTFDAPCPARWHESAPFAVAAMLGDPRDAVALLDAALARDKSVARTAVHVIQPALYDIGRLWQQNCASQAQERRATALSQDWIAKAMARASASAAPTDNGLRALFASLSGNHHVLGLRIVADSFALEGWTTHRAELGISFDTLLERTLQLRPHLIGLTASIPQQLGGVRRTIVRLQRELGDGCPTIAVGGLMFNHYPGLAQWVGGELLGTDALAAAATAHRRFAGAQ
jgi:methanogenic corrinoid protein MtbC1